MVQVLSINLTTHADIFVAFGAVTRKINFVFILVICKSTFKFLGKEVHQKRAVCREGGQ
jgi:hypothetical protein